MAIFDMRRHLICYDDEVWGSRSVGCPLIGLLVEIVLEKGWYCVHGCLFPPRPNQSLMQCNLSLSLSWLLYLCGGKESLVSTVHVTFLTFLGNVSRSPTITRSAYKIFTTNHENDPKFNHPRNGHSQPKSKQRKYSEILSNLHLLLLPLLRLLLLALTFPLVSHSSARSQQPTRTAPFSQRTLRPAQPSFTLCAEE